MTRQRKSVPSTHADGNTAILSPLRPQRNRTDEVVERLQAEIVSGRLAPGDRLPTEHGMMAAMGVSRTVVREAVAALKAEGLVTTRQGSGAYVCAETARRGFRIDADGPESLGDVLHVLELRQALEVEAASLACTRGTARQLKAITGCLRTFEEAVARGESAVPEDFAFHRAIVGAAGNPHFLRLLDLLGHVIIPRQTIRAVDLADAGNRAYLLQIEAEHRAINDAIVKRRPEEARSAMRLHLDRAAGRYRAFASARRGARKS